MTAIIAHRGFPKTGEPENSIPAFTSALEAKADGIEFDLHLTVDGHFVCFHDPDLLKLGHSGRINETKLKDLIDIELSEGVTIPSIEDILEKFGNKTLLNIELKPQKKGAEEIVQVLHQYSIDKSPEKLILSSYHGEVLRKIKSIDQEIPTGLLVNFARNQLSLAQKYNCDAFHPFYDIPPEGWTNLPDWLATRIIKYYVHKYFEQAKSLGLLVNPYTVNSPQYLKNCFKYNVYAVITDASDLAYQIRQDYS